MVRHGARKLMYETLGSSRKTQYNDKKAAYNEFKNRQAIAVGFG